jgi:RNA polymerase sigma-70 factor (ECF subfamily)
MPNAEALAAGYQANRRALVAFATRMVVRQDVAEEIVQQAAVRALEQASLPEAPSELRAWLFRVVTNLAIDHLRRHGTWRETVLDDTRTRATSDAGFVAESKLLAGSAEMKSIAKDHLAVCFSCTSRSLAPEEAAALLLKEVYDFTNDEVAGVMGASFGQAKNWIQSARAKLTERYARTCALVTQEGVCFQCVELDRFFGAD